MSPIRDRSETGACPWLARYSGLPLAEIVRLARLEQRPMRIVSTHGQAVADWLETRLTIVVDDIGEVVDLRTG